MDSIKTCAGKTVPVYTSGIVTVCGYEKGAQPEGSIYMLKVAVHTGRKSLPVPGQFYMLRAGKSGVLLGRPISIFHCEQHAGTLILEFLILEKGKGTAELCHLEAGDTIELLGPLGNTFPPPEKKSNICIIGGGIGIAPVAGFAETLPPGTYDFYASFRSGVYGLEYIQPASLTVTTDDGSYGVRGMLSAVLDVRKLQDCRYTAVYACGPVPMLAYVQNICREAGIQCWISMEARMACGMGVCLGCTIHTSKGNLRCCSDGPVFESTILTFQEPRPLPAKPRPVSEPDLSVTIAGVKFRNPVIASSGTFGFGTEYSPVFDVNRLGGISSKGLTLEPREGNSGIRLWETPSGLMNSIGLQNPGIPHFIEHELSHMLSLEPVTIANLSGSTLDTYVEGAKLLNASRVPVIELNISCPNVATGGAAFGMSCEAAQAATAAVRAVTDKPLIVKLTPQAPDVVGVAMSCREAGADAISLCNSFQGVAIDIEKGRPVFDKITAGFGGPAIRPIALRLVYELVRAMNRLPVKQQIPVIGIGGIMEWQDTVEFIMAGAAAVEVGTGTFSNPFAMTKILDGLILFMQRKGYHSLDDMRGIAQV